MILVLIPVLKIYHFHGNIRKQDWIHIYQFGLPSIIMQLLYTIYIIGLNLILKQFSEDAVTVLGIYYKLQTFFFISLMGLQQVILPMISYNYGAGNSDRIRQIRRYSTTGACVFMFLGTLCFLIFPHALLSIFSQKQNIFKIGQIAFPIIGINFVPAGINLICVVYMQGVNRGNDSMKATILREIILFVPLAWLFHFQGLSSVWFTFPVTELITTAYCIYLYRKASI